MNSNSHISSFLNVYLDEIVEPDYAVLITGSWGAGKTYFIQDYLKIRGNLKVYDSFMGNEKYAIVYVSLFGLKSKEEIDDKILDVLHPHLTKNVVTEAPRAITLLSTLAGAIFSATTAAVATGGIPVGTIVAAKKGANAGKRLGQYIDCWAGAVLKDIRKKRKKIVLIMDDVERADIPLPEFLGYVNDFVEHANIPCILIADKDNWEDALREQKNKSTLHKLSSTQEKVIGKVFQIQTTPAEVWDNWFSKESICPAGTDVKNIINKLSLKETVLDVIARTKCNNYRSLKHTLLDLQMFLKVVEKKYQKNDEFMKLLLADFFCHQYSCHVGFLKPNDMSDRTLSLASRILGKNKKKKTIGINFQKNDKTQLLEGRIVEESDESLENTYSKFLDVFGTIEKLSSISDDYFANQWSILWKKWLTTHSLSKSELDAVIKPSIWFDGKDSYELTLLYNLHMLSDSAAESALKTFYQMTDVKSDRIIKDSVLLMNLFFHLMWFAKNGYLVENPNQFYKRMETYVKLNKNELENISIVNWKSTLFSFDTYNENKTLNDKFLELLIKTLTPKIREKEKNYVNVFYEMLICGDDDKFKRASMSLSLSKELNLSELSPKKICECYKKNGILKSTELNASLKSRYSNNKDLLSSEEEYLNKILTECEKEFKSAKRPMKNSDFTLYYLRRTLKEILKTRKI